MQTTIPASGSALPTGTITFLMTDIEGSTRLWEDRPRAMAAALRRHDEIATEAFRRSDGSIIKSRGEGDSLFVVFAKASQAVEGALEFAAALQSEPWPDGISLKVRQAIHTGEAVTAAGDYYGPTINRCARLRAVGHGGQVLMSDATKSLVASQLPTGVTLRFLGSHRLKDLHEAEEVWQVVAGDLDLEFPPLRAWIEAPNNLPSAVTSFVGRDQILADIAALLAKHRMVTLCGTGGAGKSRLAVECARLMLPEFPDGAWLVELADLTDSDQIPRAIQSSLNLPPSTTARGMSSVVEAVQARSMLVVLDNCEHLLQECAQACEALVRGVPELRVLATSREPTGVPGEAVLRVPSLALPTENLQDISTLGKIEAVALFLERATAQAPDFALTTENAAAVVQICRQLDGIPLALELAAARVRALKPQDLARRLEDRFRLLTGGKAGVRARHSTLRATIDWSYQQLNEIERKAFAQLSVFAAGWTLELAERVCGDGVDEWEVLDILTALVDKSLVIFEAGAHGRYFYLESIRAFAKEQLASGPEEAAATHLRHARTFSAWGMDRVLLMRTAEEPRAVDELVRESHNIIAALGFAKTEADAGMAAQLALALSAARQRRGYQRDAVTPIDEALGLASKDDSIDPVLRARLLTERAGLAIDLLCSEQAGPLAVEAQQIAHASGDIGLLIRSENLLGQVAMEAGDLATTRAHYNEALRLSESQQIWTETARLRNNLGIVERRDPDGDKDLAASHYQAALHIQRENHDVRGEAETLNSYGVLEHSRGRHSEAAELYLAAAKLESQLEHRFGVAKTLSNFGEAWLEAQEFERAARALAVAEQLFLQIRSPYREYTAGLLTSAAEKLGWPALQVEEFRAGFAAVELADAVSVATDSSA